MRFVRVAAGESRSGRTLGKGAGNLANSPAAFQISLTIRLVDGRCRTINPPSAQEPDLIRTLVKGDRCACITQPRGQSRRVSALQCRAAHQ
jgi:hypothetical protein